MRSVWAWRAGFSLIEVLVVVAVLGVLASVLLPSIQGGPDAAKLAKLNQDVVIVNNAIDAYLTAGGSQGALSAGNVISALKQRVLGGPAAEMTGPLGPFLDPRVVTNATDFDYSAIFETSPRPRFVVQKSRSGVKFGLGLPSPVGGPSTAANPSWLWSYTPAVAAGSVSKPIFEPGTIDPGTTLGTTNTVLVGLSCPDISPASQTFDLTGFPLVVSLSNPNPAGSSIAYYKIDSGTWTLWVGSPFTVDPGSKVTATAVSIDPSRYYNSSSCSETYDLTPWKLEVVVTAPGSVTYAQAGGLMVDIAQLAPVEATVSLANVGDIPAPYLSSSYFTIRYTVDGSDPLSSGAATNGPSFSGSLSDLKIPLGLSRWGTNNEVTIRAAAVSAKPAWFVTSPVDEGVATKALTPLGLAIVPANPIGLPVTVLINESGVVPVGLRKYYTTGGSSPLSMSAGGVPVTGAIIYNGPISGASLPSSSYTLTAQATGPSGYESWFSSAPVTRNYNTVTTLPSEFVGANISGGDVNGSFKGSIFVAAPADLGIFNAGGQITGGNLYVPGLPAIEIPGSGNSSKTVASRGQAYVDSGQIPRSLIGGKEFAADGQLAVPQLDTRQIVDLNGSVNPTNYTVKLTKSAYIEGKIYRRSDPPPPPARPTVPTGLPEYEGQISGTFTTNIPPGVYADAITMNSTNSVLQLGQAGTTTVSQYVFTDNTWTKGTVEILSPVEIFFLNGFDNKGVTFGNSNNIVEGGSSLLRINVMNDSVDLTGGATVYAAMWAGDSAVTVGNGSFFYGSMYVRTLIVAPGGVVDVE